MRRKRQYVTDDTDVSRGTLHPRPQQRAWEIGLWRPLWVCCYAWVNAYPDPAKGGWVMMANHWVNDTRRWKLITIKTFKSMDEVNASHSMQRLYAPFNSPHALVVLRTRTQVDLKYITEYKLYGNKEGPS